MKWFLVGLALCFATSAMGQAYWQFNSGLGAYQLFVRAHQCVNGATPCSGSFHFDNTSGSSDASFLVESSGACAVASTMTSCSGGATNSIPFTNAPCSYQGCIENPDSVSHIYYVTAVGYFATMQVNSANSECFAWTDPSCSGSNFTYQMVATYTQETFTPGLTATTNSAGIIEPGVSPVDPVFSGAPITGAGAPAGGSPPAPSIGSVPPAPAPTNNPIVYSTNANQNATNSVNNQTISEGNAALYDATTQGDANIVNAVRQADIDVVGAIKGISNGPVNVTVTNTGSGIGDYTNVLNQIQTNTATALTGLTAVNSNLLSVNTNLNQVNTNVLFVVTNVAEIYGAMTNASNNFELERSNLSGLVSTLSDTNYLVNHGTAAAASDAAKLGQIQGLFSTNLDGGDSAVPAYDASFYVLSAGGYTFDLGLYGENSHGIGELANMTRTIIYWLLSFWFIAWVVRHVMSYLKILPTAKQMGLPNINIEALGFGGNFGASLYVFYVPVMVILMGLLPVAAFTLLTGQFAPVVSVLGHMPWHGLTDPAVKQAIALTDQFFPLAYAVYLAMCYVVNLVYIGSVYSLSTWILRLMPG